MAEIKKLEWEDVLNELHNIFLSKLASGMVDVKIYTEICRIEGKKVQVDQKPVQMGVDPSGRPIMGMTKVTSGEALTNSELNVKNNQRIVEKIEEVMREKNV